MDRRPDGRSTRQCYLFSSRALLVLSSGWKYDKRSTTRQLGSLNIWRVKLVHETSGHPSVFFTTKKANLAAELEFNLPIFCTSCDVFCTMAAVSDAEVSVIHHLKDTLHPTQYERSLSNAEPTGTMKRSFNWPSSTRVLLSFVDHESPCGIHACTHLGDEVA